MLEYFGGRLREALKTVIKREDITEIRIRADKPLLVRLAERELFLNREGQMCQPEEAYRPSAHEISLTFELMCNYSVYAFQEEIRTGYITVAGGHRVGVFGRAVIENGEVKSIRSVSGLSFRISREIKGCADRVMRFLSPPMNTLIISPPGRGKTTLMRDIVRQFSDGGYTVGIVDERSELAGCYQGVPQKDVGIRTDVLDACPKDRGMMLLLRSQNPNIIAVDEIGGRGDIAAMTEIVHAGVNILCTAHGSGLSDVRPLLKELRELNVFERHIVISPSGKPGEIEGIYDGELVKCT